MKQSFNQTSVGVSVERSLDVLTSKLPFRWVDNCQMTIPYIEMLTPHPRTVPTRSHCRCHRHFRRIKHGTKRSRFATVMMLVSLMAQPRLTFNMASDGLLPAIFAQFDSTGILQGGTLVSGLVMTFVATFIPVVYLNDLISAGILLASSMTNSCLLLLRCEPPNRQPKLLERSLDV